MSLTNSREPSPAKVRKIVGLPGWKQKELLKQDKKSKNHSVERFDVVSPKRTRPVNLPAWKQKALLSTEPMPAEDPHKKVTFPKEKIEVEPPKWKVKEM